MIIALSELFFSKKKKVSESFARTPDTIFYSAKHEIFTPDGKRTQENQFTIIL
jgi:hypothetical protein